MNTSLLRPTPAARSRYGALALLLGGPLSLVFHALWRIGHVPTVVNEHGVVLGLTNDQWSYLGAAWMAPVALGALAICALHQGTLPQMTATLVVPGLAPRGGIGVDLAALLPRCAAAIRRHGMPDRADRA